ncbi:HAD hydrolase-like protein [Dokdonella sp. MW10]|uniref:HAD hydrolase-like protein n=1 Tax=Dokdonella sp. MW10 TaxID=2992926 RepID=UPI003F7E3816
MRYRLVLFDFDGTLADSFPFFAATFNGLAARHGFRTVDAADVATLRGMGPREIMAHVGMPAWKLPIVARDFIAAMRAGRSSIRLFGGIADVLVELDRRGVAIAVVSSNARDNVEAVLGPSAARVRHVECGMSMFGKAARIRKVLRASGVAAHEAISIGDQASDFECSRKAGVAFGAVAWGYATIESLAALGPDMRFIKVEDLLRIADDAAR